MIKYFNDIKKNNKFNPRFTKRFNYTNWKNSVSKEEESTKKELKCDHCDFKTKCNITFNYKNE